MLSKKEELLKDIYKVNEKEYLRILKEENNIAWDFEEWKIFYKWVGINKKLNDIFQYNSFIYKLFCSSSYSNLIADKNKEGYIGKLNSFDFDHTTSIQLRPDVSKIPSPDTITGIVTFPYFNKWEEIKNWIDKVPKNACSVYILNPILIFYGIGTVGLFLTPTYYNGINIELCNRYIISLTGYPLFLTFSDEEDVEEIRYADLELCIENFINEIYELSGKNNALLKMLNFWKDNDDVSISLIEECYENYLEIQPYLYPNNINFLKLKSKRHFKLVDNNTEEILGPFKEFVLDGEFNMIFDGKNKHELSNRQLNDLLNGKYDFIMI